MKIYIEQLLLTNFVIDFCILVMVSKFIFSKTTYKHIFVSALFGSVASLILPYCTNFMLTNIFKILTSIIMLQLLHIPKKQLPISCALMLCLSYIIGGVILSTFGKISNGGCVISNTNLIYVFIITILFTFILSKLIIYLKHKITTNSNILDTTLILNSNKITIKSFIDSGNALYDNNQPISLINFDTFTKLTNITLNQYLTNNFNTLINPHFINANTIAGNRKILI
ncbi:MAG: sigma-E processing peptidase SpoIIGA, partial [Clostridia bacterium]